MVEPDLDQDPTRLGNELSSFLHFRLDMWLLVKQRTIEDTLEMMLTVCHVSEPNDRQMQR